MSRHKVEIANVNTANIKVLTNNESTGLSRYIVRRFSKNIEDSESYEDLLGDEFSGISKDLGTVRK